MSTAARSTCSPTAPATPLPRRSKSCISSAWRWDGTLVIGGTGSTGEWSAIKRLGNDADVGDAGLLHGIHHRGKGAKWYALVGAHVDGLPWVGALRQNGCEVVDVDRLVV